MKKHGGMRDMVVALMTVDKIIETKNKKPNKTEAARILRSCGILDDKNNIRPAYKGLVIKQENKNDRD